MIACEQLRPDVVRRRRNFTIARRFADPDRFVFLDESRAKTNMTRLYGRSPIGERCRFYGAHGPWTATTMVSAIRRRCVIVPATLLLDGPMNAATFLGYIECYLAPALRPGEIMVMDNLGAHKAAGVEEVIDRRARVCGGFRRTRRS